MQPVQNSISAALLGLMLIFSIVDRAGAADNQHQATVPGASSKPVKHLDTPASTLSSPPISHKTVSVQTTENAQTRSQKSKTPIDPNRRWIMKQRDHRQQVIKPRTHKPLKWKTSAQKQACQSLERRLSATFEKAQFYSVQGDRCKTARFAGKFLETAQECRSGCPDNFLASHGFSDPVIRNMNQLNALGLKSCLGTSTKPNAKKATP